LRRAPREAEALARLAGGSGRAISSGEVFKDGGTCTVARIVVERPRAADQALQPQEPAARARPLWRPSRAWHSWREAHRLQFFGIPTPRPLALIEERCGPLRRRAWLISEYCPGPNLLRHLPADREPPAAEGKAIASCLQRCAAAHQPWRPQGDESALGRRQVLLIDLDGVVQHRSAIAHARAWRRDRARLLRNWPSGCALQRWLDEQLPAA
jgi:hypothetical protein